MKILLLNDAYFLASFRRLGHEVFFVSPSPQADCVLSLEPVDLQPILGACPFQPDVLVLSDSINLRAAYLGWEKIQAPRIFYGVDAPMNAFWQGDFCPAFDLAFLDQKSAVMQIKSSHPDAAPRVRWLPLGADPQIFRSLPLEKTYEITFIGTVNPRLRPKRSWMLAELKRHYHVTIFDGQNQRSLAPVEVNKIYNQSRLVLNENLFAGLNLRTFEALSSGACLLTEPGDDSWKDFFQDWKHLVTFTPENLLDRVDKLLDNQSLRERIAQEGMALVRRAHTIDHRAAILLSYTTQRLASQPKANVGTQGVFHLGKAFLTLSARWPNQPVAALRPEGIRLLWDQATNGLESADLHFELGAQALEEGRKQHACGSLERALELDPAHLRSLWAYFWCLRELGDPGAAALELSRLNHYLGRQISDSGFWRRLPEGGDLTAADYCILGETLEKAHLIIEPGIDRLLGHPCRWNAYDVYQKAIFLNPHSEKPYLHCVNLLERVGSYEFALLFMEKVVELQPLEAAWRLRLAYFYLSCYRREEGVKQLLEYLFLSNEPEKWEKVETLGLAEAERNYLLNSVWDYSRRPAAKPWSSESPLDVEKVPLKPVSWCEESV